MNLEELSRFMSSKKKEFQDSVKVAAQGVTFEEIKKEMEIDAFQFKSCGRYSDFKDGQRIEFMFHEGLYSAQISRDELILNGPYNIEITRFEGEVVRSFYEELVTKIKEIQEKEDLPF